MVHTFCMMQKTICFSSSIFNLIKLKKKCSQNVTISTVPNLLCHLSISDRKKYVFATSESYSQCLSNFSLIFGIFKQAQAYENSIFACIHINSQDPQKASISNFFYAKNMWERSMHVSFFCSICLYVFQIRKIQFMNRRESHATRGCVGIIG